MRREVWPPDGRPVMVHLRHESMLPSLSQPGDHARVTDFLAWWRCVTRLPWPWRREMVCPCGAVLWDFSEVLDHFGVRPVRPSTISDEVSNEQWEEAVIAMIVEVKARRGRSRRREEPMIHESLFDLPACQARRD